MDKVLSKKQFFSLTASFLLGNTLAVAGGVTGNDKTGYLTLWISFGLYVVLCLIYGNLFSKNKTNDLYLITENLMGKALSKFLLFFVFLYSLITGILSTIEFSVFVSLSSGGELSKLSISILLGICIFCMLLFGKRAIAGYSMLAFPFVLFMLFLAVIMSFGKMNISNLSFEEIPKITTVFKSTALNFISPFSNIIIICYLMSDSLDTKDFKSQSIKAGALSAFVISLVYAWNILIIGKELMGKVYFPTLFSLSIVNPSFFSGNLENIFFVTYIFLDVLYIGVSYLTAIFTFEKIFFKNNTLSKSLKKILYAILGILTVLSMNFPISEFTFYSSFEGIAYITAIITVGIPLILQFVSLIKKT